MLTTLSVVLIEATHFKSCVWEPVQARKFGDVSVVAGSY